MSVCCEALRGCVEAIPPMTTPDTQVKPASPTLCGACSEPFADPRLLPCLHSFCRTCLEREAAKGAGDTVACPTCQRHAPLPPGDSGGVAALPKNLHLAFEVEVAKYCTIIESTSDIKCDSCSVPSNGPSRAFCCTCQEFLCQFCWDYHKTSHHLQSHETMPLSKELAQELPLLVRPPIPLCKRHEKPLKFFCRVCKCPVCHACIAGPQTAVSQHFGHTYTGVGMAAEEYRKVLRSTLGSVKGTLGMVERVESQVREVRGTVEATLDGLEEALGGRKKTALALLDRRLQDFVQPFREEGGRLDEVTQYISGALQTHSDNELVVLKDFFALILREVQGTCEQFLSSSIPTLTIINPAMSKVLNEIEKLDIFVACPSKSTWTQLHISPPVVHTPYQVRLETRDFSGGLVMSGGLEVVVELRSKMDDPPCTRGKVEDHGDGTYTITITPLATGHYWQCISIQGHYVSNSPSQIHVTKGYKSWVKAEMSFEIDQPFFIAFDDHGNIYVTSGGVFPVYVFDSKGRPKHGIGERGSGEGQFNNPRGIAIKDDVMYIADYSNNRVQKMTTKGQFLLSFGHCRSRGDTSMKGPLGVCVDHKGRVIVAEYGNHQVKLYSANGVSLQSIIGVGSSGVPRFIFPCAVAVDLEGNIHVGAKPSTKGGTVVTVFSAEGDYLRSYGVLRNAISLSVSLHGHIAVCEFDKRSAVHVFDGSAKGVKVDIVQAEDAFALAFGEGCNLYVSMHKANKVVRY